MISDSPYQVGDEIYKPLGGFLAGVVGGLVMLAFFSLIMPILPFTTSGMLETLGAQFLSWTTLGSQGLVIGGAVIFLLVAALGGLLYGVSQRSIPNDALLIVGASFGILAWLVDNLFGLFMTIEMRMMMRTWQWLVANVLFGLTLALIAVAAKSISGQQQRTVKPRH
jgi:hypothetical protein